MTRGILDNKIQRLLEDVLVLDSLVEEAIFQSVEALKKHNLERAADRVSNICERTIYIATGELQEIDIDVEEISRV